MHTFHVSVEVPEGLEVAYIRVKHDGAWEVALSNRTLGVYASAVHRVAQSACDLAAERALPAYEAAREKWDAQQATAAARAAARGTTPSAAAPRATGEPLRAAGAVVINWDGPVPRNAAHWEASRTPTGELESIFVVLRDGLYFGDGTRERRFKTLRSAKDDVRAATTVRQESLF